MAFVDKYQICILSGTRADYGLLRPLIARVANEDGMKLRLLVTGAHLSAEFGNTCKEIEADKHAIHAKIEILLSSDTASAMAKSTGVGMSSFADYFANSKPDILIVLGDRFEAFAAASAAAIMRIPIAHIFGGDTSEGAVDEFMRHSITKMSSLHFPSNDESAGRIIQMGEAPETVHNVGSLHVECIKNTVFLSRDELQSELGFSGVDFHKPYALATYHPVTQSGETASVDEMKKLLSTLRRFSGTQFIFTKANADSGGQAINKLLDAAAERSKNICVFSSLGSLRYLSTMRFADAVIGNSSSGMYEAPILGIPAVNIGDRQKGRLCPDNVINCAPVYDDIVLAIKKAFSDEFKRHAKNVRYPYGDGKTSRFILEYLKSYLKNKRAGSAATSKHFHRIS
jgi:GDP/UDP-N,N'-diacetylbacillosamine 2-epimerase (hydrolysing)